MLPSKGGHRRLLEQRDVAGTDEDMTGGYRDDACHAVEQRALARAAWPHDAEKLSFFVTIHSRK